MSGISPYTIARPEDDCYPEAAAMSCDVMTWLARDEAARNQAMLERNVQHPTCERFQALADRQMEYKLQKPDDVSRKMCFTKTPAFQGGDWAGMFDAMRIADPRAIRFDESTRARTANKSA